MRIKSCKNGQKLQPGDKIHRFTLVKYLPGGFWECICDCGNVLNVKTGAMNSGNTKSCGCFRKEVCHENNKYKILKDPRVVTANQIYHPVYDDGNITLDKFIELSQLNCYYCGVKPYLTRKGIIPQTSNFTAEEVSFTYNGLDRIDSSKPHDLDNVVTCCWTCNNAKKNRTVDEFYTWINTLKPFVYENYEVKSLILPDNIHQCYSIRCAFIIYKDGDLNIEQFYYLTQQNCVYCDSTPLNCYNKPKHSKKSTVHARAQGDFIYNGLDRIDSERGHFIDNVVPACKWCNYAKKDMMLNEFNEWIIRIQSYQNNILI